MKLLLINVVCGSGSTGKIVRAIAEDYEAKGYEVRIGDGGFARPPEACMKWIVPIGNLIGRRVHALLTRLLDWHGDKVCSYFATRKFIKWAEDWKPDVVWLHNIHGYYLNYPLLFAWLKRHPEIEVKWTLHDCWPFTGHCSHFIYTKCEQWVRGCEKCPARKEYPKSWFLSRARAAFESKRKAFCGVTKMTIITPSQWLADLVGRSFLKEYPVEVVHNTIDTNVFRPTKGNIKERYGLVDKRVILGVASKWDDRKGLADFFKLRELLSEDYAIVLIGLTAKQIAALPRGIFGIARTNNAHELAEWYSAADWFFNPTREDNYPTVNLEAVACGCAVITYDVGGCRETVEGDSKSVVLKTNTPEEAKEVISCSR